MHFKSKIDHILVYSIFDLGVMGRFIFPYSISLWNIWYFILTYPETFIIMFFEEGLESQKYPPPLFGVNSSETDTCA